MAFPFPEKMEFEKAKAALFEAVNLDQRGLTEQAIEKYMIGIEALLLCQTEFEDQQKREALKRQVEQYMSRAETLKAKSRAETLKAIKVEFLEQRRIAENSVGHSYESIFARCLGNTVTEVNIEEPWLNYHYQVVNLVKFCELLIRSCPKIRLITLLTQPKSLVEAIEELRGNLRTKHVELQLKYRENLHDREIRFNSGWLVKMGRGLDIYKNVGKFSIGSYDYHFRPCKATLIEIFRISTS